MRQILPLIFLAIFSVGFSSSAVATHLLGGHVYSECTGNCTYRIFVTEYYDCNSGIVALLPNLPTPPNNLLFTSGLGCNPPIPLSAWQVFTYLDVSNLCPSVPSSCNVGSTGSAPGILEAVFFRDYDLCSVNCQTVEVSYINCCRQPSLTSLVNPSSSSLSLSTLTIDLTQPSCNSSAQIMPPPPFYICSGQAQAYPLHAFDPDGDSLVYSLGPCYDSQGSTVTYNNASGYSPSAPLGLSWNVSIDPASGLLSFVPNPVGNLVSGVICVYVDEYRNGLLVGSNSNDFAVTVISCGTTNQPPAIAAAYGNLTNGLITGADTILAYSGQVLSFTRTVTDPDAADSLFISGDLAQQIPTASLTVSGVNPLSADFSWTPTQADSGFYSFTLVAKDNGCLLSQYDMSKTVIHVVPFGISAFISDSECELATGSISITVQGGLPPYIFIWNNGQSGQDLFNLFPGTYWLTVMDSTGLSVTDSFFVSANNLVLTASVTPSDCDNNNGSIALSMTGGTPPYTYAWSTGATTDSIGGLAPGGYSVVITDAAACPKQEIFLLPTPDSCIVNISGTIYQDLNGNCVQDSGEPGIPNVLVDITPGGMTLTDAQGGYTLLSDTGAYSIDIIPIPFSNVICPAGGTHNLTFNSYFADTSGVDFAVDFVPVQDLRVNGYQSPTRPGFTHSYHFASYNEGSVSVNATLKWTHDPLVSITAWSLAPTVYDPVLHMAEWQLGNFPPGALPTIGVLGYLDSSVSLGTPIVSHLELIPVVGDTTPANNLDTLVKIVVGSYDPNDKAVNPAGIGPEGFIRAGLDPLTYTLRFQNTGTDTAFYVILRDTLSSALDPATFQVGSSSHTYSLDIEDDSILVFTFANIGLPDSATNPLGSQGHAQFKIRQKPGLQPGTGILNRGAIYFDFNFPVFTNSTLNTIYIQPEIEIQNDPVICTGDMLSANLTVQGLPPYTFNWSNGFVDTGNLSGQSGIVPDSSGTWSVTVTDALGFSTSTQISIQIMPDPVADFSFATAGIPNSVQFTDNSLDADSWLWSFGDGNTSTSQDPLHSYSAAGTYTVMLEASNDCAASSQSQTVTVSGSTGLNGLFGEGQIAVMPNPIGEQTVITFPNPNKDLYRLTLYDMAGKQIREVLETREGKFEVKRADLPSGIYLFGIQGPQQGFGRLLVD